MKPPEDETKKFEFDRDSNKRLAIRIDTILKETGKAHPEIPFKPPREYGFGNFHYRNRTNPNMIVNLSKAYERVGLNIIIDPDFPESDVELEEGIDIPAYSISDHREIFNPHRRIETDDGIVPQYFWAEGNFYSVRENYLLTSEGQGFRSVIVFDWNEYPEFLKSGKTIEEWVRDDFGHLKFEFDSIPTISVHPQKGTRVHGLHQGDYEKIGAILTGIEKGDFQPFDSLAESEGAK